MEMVHGLTIVHPMIVLRALGISSGLESIKVAVYARRIDYVRNLFGYGAIFKILIANSSPKPTNIY